MFKVFNFKRIIIILLIFLIFLIFFSILYYKKIFLGNNIVKNRMDEILSNLQNYETDMKVEIISNKTNNKYIVHQSVKENECIEEIFDEDNNEILKLKYERNDLKILNEKMDLVKIYQNFNDLVNDSLFLSEFLKECNNSQNMRNIYEEDNKIFIEVNIVNNQNTYTKYKILELDSKTLIPLKLQIKDENQNQKIIIEYSNMEIN